MFEQVLDTVSTIVQRSWPRAVTKKPEMDGGLERYECKEPERWTDVQKQVNKGTFWIYGVSPCILFLQ